MESVSPTEADLYSGRAVFMFTYDLAYDMRFILDLALLFVGL